MAEASAAVDSDPGAEAQAVSEALAEARPEAEEPAENGDNVTKG